MSKIVSTQTLTAPAAVGPYSQATIYGYIVYCSGQIGIDPKNNNLVEGIENQTHQVMNNLEAVLKASGSDFNSVLKTTIYLANMSNYAVVNEIYGSYFSTHKPARVTIEVSRLPKNALIEIDAVAIQNIQ